MRTIDLIDVHHSAGIEHATVEQLRREHVEQRGWSDIGYHFVLHRLYKGGPWVISPGRPLELVGAHDAGQNPGSIGVCVCGDYTKGPVDRWAWRLLVDFVAQLCADFHLSAEGGVEGHKEREPASTPTACPGFDPNALRRDVGALLARAA